MNALKDGGPAFAMDVNSANGAGAPIQRGMSLRDWFAGEAAGSLMGHCIETIDLPPEGIAKAAATVAYLLADALLAERAKSGGAS